MVDDLQNNTWWTNIDVTDTIIAIIRFLLHPMCIFMPLQSIKDIPICIPNYFLAYSLTCLLTYLLSFLLFYLPT